MSRAITRSLLKSLPSAVATVILGSLISYFLLPTNVGFTFWGIFLTAIACGYVMMTSEENKKIQNRIALGLGIVTMLLIASMFFSPIVFTRIDNAKYFDSVLKYQDKGSLPFQTKINGSELRVTDKGLAESLMDQSNYFGSNKAIYSIHLGNYHGKTYWIGAAIFDGLILNDQKNQIDGFILVDFSDPTLEPIIIEQNFKVDVNLFFNHDLNRKVWMHNINYEAGDNYYFSYNDQADRMELIVPYSIRDSTFLGSKYGGFVTQDMRLKGGVLIYGPDGELIHDYTSNQLEDVPAHARIQVYSETWLETQIDRWGRSLVADHDVRWNTALPWIKSERRLGIDDDVRVVINPDNFQSTQYILLDSTGSTNQILRGAIKANVSGLFYYNFEKYLFKDTDTALEHVVATINNLKTSSNPYTALLPILYPIKENITSLSDYAYVMALQIGNSKFGGIAITNPADKSGSQTVVEFINEGENVKISEVVNKAIDKYLNIVGNSDTSNNGTGSITGDFKIDTIRSYQKDGQTIYAMEGNFSGLNENIRVLFTQQRITNEQQWLEVVFANVGDTLTISIQQLNGIYYAQSIVI